ncbi:type VI secretion system protein TssA [Acetobacter sp. DsW_063]|uniref:type VI secretion system protein TssA n=1 Tax=Acetobacter sp. DsW_063 TaxID=1514894 RepID=UPI001302A4A0|nr:type VI secretion system protein TssA [Acetobacter sp. DsW_063]
MLDSTQEQLLERVAAPLGDDAPCGVDLRENLAPQSLYSRLRDARSEARAQERTLDDDPSVGTGVGPSWATVADLAEEALTGLSKDLEVGCWMTEALTRQLGLVGLALGARIMTALVTSFWNSGLYPSLEVDDPEVRTFAVSGLSGSEKDGSLIQPLRKIELFTLSNGEPLTFWQYERAREISVMGAKAKSGNLPTLEALEAIARGPGRPQLATMGREAAFTRIAWSEFQSSLETIHQTTDTLPETPSMTRVARILDELVQIAARYVPPGELQLESVEAEEEAAPVTDGEEVAALSDNPTASAQPKPLTREDLLDEALRIAALFREREPNSPFSYTLEDAVRRARMTLPELLLEIVADGASRADIMTRLGIQTPEG